MHDYFTVCSKTQEINEKKSIYKYNISIITFLDRARDFNIVLDDVALTELSFGRDYSAAVESKQVAQQEAQRAVFVVERALQEKQQKIVQAEGNFLEYFQRPQSLI